MILMTTLALLSPNGPYRDCGRCHQPSGWHDLKTPDEFAHEETGFPLWGAHRALSCAACHQGARVERACGSCHEDAHRGRHGDQCERCHTPRSWRMEAGQQAHQRTRLPLIGAHALTPCSRCHPQRDDSGYQPVPADCRACHLKDVARAEHPPHTAPAFAQCEVCHTPYGWRPAQILHDRFWPLTGAHRKIDCFECHPRSRYTGTPRDCFLCHQADFARAHAPSDPRDCARCHTTVAFARRPLEATQALRAARLSQGGHRFPTAHAPRCQDCHPRGPRSLDCLGCHAGKRARGAHRRVPGFSLNSRRCARCHPDGRSR
ncbi:hypothetical protein KKF91_02295 [Myxococcota bacterium]|nr:hypothetical protein [Myxococcota bacterium]